MKKVLMIDHAPIFGGAEAFLLDLVSAIDRQQFSPIIVTAPDTVVLHKFKATGLPVFTTPFPRLNRSPLLFWHLLTSGLKLARLAQDAQADVMHTFTARTHLVGAIASKISGIPLLWRIGDDTLPPWLMYLFGRLPRRIVGVSQWITTCYPKLHFHGLVPDGARPPSPITRNEARAEFGFMPDDLVVAHVGRLVRWKGQLPLIKALAKVKPIIPQVKGLIIGEWNADDTGLGPLSGGEAYYNELQSTVKELGLQNHITFAGFVRDPGLGYAAADVFTHTSTLPEPFGRVVIEAMIAGCAVIGAKAGAQPEIIIQGQTGLLSPPDDHVALAQALIALLSSPEKRTALALAGQKRAESEYTLNIMTRRMEATYLATLK